MRLLELGTAMAEGVLTIPTDLYYGLRRTAEDVGVFGKDVQQQNRDELERVGKLIRSTFENRNVIYRMVRLILDDFFENLPESVKEKILEKSLDSSVKLVSRKGTQFALSNIVAAALAEKITAKILVQRLVKFGVGAAVSAVLIQGILERSSNACGRLKQANARLFHTLQKQNLDPLYFLVEETLAPIISAGLYEKVNYRRYNDIMNKLQAEIQ